MIDKASQSDRNEKNQRNKRKLILLILATLLLALCLISILVWQGLTQPEMSKTQEAPVLNQAIGNYIPGEDLLLVSGGKDISVLIPGCAIDQKGKIVLTPLGEYLNDQVEEDTVWSRPRTADVSFYSRSNELIDDLPINCSIRVCFTLTKEEWENYLDYPEDFEIQYLDDSDTPSLEWISVLMVAQRSSHELCGNYNQLGLFALAMKTVSIGETGGLYDILEPTTTPTQPGLYEPPSD